MNFFDLLLDILYLFDAFDFNLKRNGPNNIIRVNGNSLNQVENDQNIESHLHINLDKRQSYPFSNWFILSLFRILM